MHRVDIRNVNIGQIQSYITVVRLNSFTKAAAQLHVGQSTVSKSIKSLEDMLGLQLFIRGGGKNELTVTPAGETLFQKWSDVAEHLETAVQEAHMVQTGIKKNIVVVGLDSYKPEKIILPAVLEFKGKYPDISVKVETMPAEEVRKSMVLGEADVAFTVLYDIEQMGLDKFEYKLLAECSHVACMLPDNPLSDKQELDICDLKQSNFISISPLKTPSYCIAIDKLCREHGFVPNITNYTQNAVSLSFNLTNANDIFICDRFYRDYSNPNIKVVPIKDTKSGLVLGWKKDNNKPEVKHFINETINYAVKHPL